MNAGYAINWVGKLSWWNWWVNRLKKILRILIPSGSDTYHISQTNCTLYIHNPIQAEVRKSSSRGHEVGNLVFTLKFRKHGQPAPSPMARNWASSSFPSSCDANAFTPPRSHTLKSGSCAAARKQTQFRRLSDAMATALTILTPLLLLANAPSLCRANEEYVTVSGTLET